MARLSPLFTWRSAIADSDLPPRARHVALALSLHMSERGDSCFPSLKTLAAETGLSKSTVVLGVKDLKASGFIETLPGGKGKGGRTYSTRYVAVFPEVSDERTVDDESVRPPNESVRPPAQKGPSVSQESVKRASLGRSEEVSEINPKPAPMPEAVREQLRRLAIAQSKRDEELAS